MNKARYDSDSIKLIALFESMTGAKVKDCISNEKILFIIEENDMGKAIGKNGSSIKRVENALKKKIKLAEFSNDALQLIKNLIYPAELLNIKQEGNVVTLYGKDAATKAMIVGRERQNINHIKDIVNRYFDIKEIKIA